MIYIANVIHANGNGYCIVSADNPKQVKDIINSQGRFRDTQVVDMKKLCWQDSDTHIIFEGAITTAGKTDYELALKNGFTGTVQEWLASLKGEKGDPGSAGPQGPAGPRGEKGDAFIYADFTPEQLRDLIGPKGDKGDKGDPLQYEDWDENSKVLLSQTIMQNIEAVLNFAEKNDVDAFFI